MQRRDRFLAPFERWGPHAFVAGGVGLLGTTVTGSLHIAGVAAAPPRLLMGPLLVGLWFVFVGLVGFYPTLADAASRLSTGGVVISGIAWVIWTATMAAAIGVDLATQRTFVDPGSWAPPLLAGGFVLALLSFLLYGVASTRAETPSRTVGVLLLVPVAAFFGQAILLVSKIVTGSVQSGLQLALGGVIGLTLIAVGYLLVTGRATTAASESEAGVTT